MFIKAKLIVSISIIFILSIFSFSQQSTATASAQGQGYTLKVTVGISPALKSKSAPEQVVFVFAKAVTGPRAPLAAVRAQVKDLPLTVTLDDSMAMAPMFRLSMFKDVNVSARVSQDGQAIKKSGDFEGLSPNIKLVQDNKPITVIIDHIVP